MSEQPDTTDDETDSTLRPTRRQTLGALAAAGVLGATAVGQEEGDLLNAGGGPMSDAQDEFRVQRYRGTFDERPEPGVARRVWEVDDPGHENHGAIYVDDGESWELVDRKVGSLHADQVGIGEGEDTSEPTIFEHASGEQLEFRPDGTLATPKLEVGEGSLGDTGEFSEMSLDSAQTIPNDDTTTIEFDTVENNQIGSFDTSEGTFTPDEAGTYLITASIVVDDAPDDGALRGSIIRSGSPIRPSYYTFVMSGQRQTLQFSIIDTLDESSEIEAMLRQRTGSDLDLLDSNQTWFRVVKL